MDSAAVELLEFWKVWLTIGSVCGIFAFIAASVEKDSDFGTTVGITFMITLGWPVLIIGGLIYGLHRLLHHFGNWTRRVWDL